MADYRYLEAWKKPITSFSFSFSSSSSSRPSAPSTANYDNNSYQDFLPTTQSTAPDVASTSLQIRLDTPGGITYVPDVLSQHNSAKRLFIPATLSQGGRADEYDFAQDITTRGQKKSTRAAAVGAKQDVDRKSDAPTDAQAYAASIATAQGGQAKQVKFAEKPYAISQGDSGDAAASTTTNADQAPNDGHSDTTDAASLFSTNTATTVRSNSSRMTAMTLAVDPQHGTLPHSVSSNATVTHTKLPPSVAGDGSEKRPWTTTEWTGHRALDWPSQREKEAGITNAEDVGGQGRFPRAEEIDLLPSWTTTPNDDDGASVRTATTVGASSSHFRPSDLFVPDPRPWRPLRYVRKVDPRQVLLMCAGTTLTAGQVAANRIGGMAQSDAASIRSSITAAPSTALTHQAARKSMMNFGKMPDYDSLASQLSSATLSTFDDIDEVRGGLGFVFCPISNPSSSSSSLSSRLETNFSRRLERPPELANTTKKRAGLRSVLAALEYQWWEEEGFDKIVIATHHRWLVEGISRDIWQWRHDDWRLTREGPLGMPGDSVPDRDLWELLDGVVKKYEEIDCTVRFWYVPRTENMAAFRLAEQGATKDNQQAGLVRWTKPKPKVTQHQPVRLLNVGMVASRKADSHGQVGWSQSESCDDGGGGGVGVGSDAGA